MSRNTTGEGPLLRALFSSAFSRSSPTVDADSPTVLPASWLRFHPIEAALILVRNLEPMRMGTKHTFIGGYPIINNIMKQSPDDFYKFLFEPCVRNAMAIEVASADQTLRDLLNLIKETRFGFTTLTEGNLFSVVGLSDLIQLYKDATIETDLIARDVASRPFSMSRGTTIKDALGQMLERRIRRVFFQGTEAFVSDREIISSILSPRKLQETRDSPRKMLDCTIEDAGPVDAQEVEGDMPLREAARLVMHPRGVL